VGAPCGMFNVVSRLLRNEKTGVRVHCVISFKKRVNSVAFLSSLTPESHSFDV
jgi:hypothetical protein